MDLVSDLLLGFVGVLLLCAAYPVYIIYAQHPDLVSKTSKFLTSHNLYNLLLLLIIKTVDTFTLELHTQFAHNLIIINFHNRIILLFVIFLLILLLLLIFLYFWTTRMTIFRFCSRWVAGWHCRRLYIVMLVFYVGVQSCI